MHCIPKPLAPSRIELKILMTRWAAVLNFRVVVQSPSWSIRMLPLAFGLGNLALRISAHITSAKFKKKTAVAANAHSKTVNLHPIRLSLESLDFNVKDPSVGLSRTIDFDDHVMILDMIDSLRSVLSILEVLVSIFTFGIYDRVS
jgi:hypothetical protein